MTRISFATLTPLICGLLVQGCSSPAANPANRMGNESPIKPHDYQLTMTCLDSTHNIRLLVSKCLEADNDPHAGNVSVTAAGVRQDFSKTVVKLDFSKFETHTEINYPFSIDIRTGTLPNMRLYAQVLDDGHLVLQGHSKGFGNVVFESLDILRISRG